jgi:glutamate/tyrosine decarboxylase-like PLP-dependent enzyme
MSLSEAEATAPGESVLARQDDAAPNAAKPKTPLFPDDAQRRAVDDWLTRALEAARRRVHAGPVRPTTSPAFCAEALRGFDFTSPRDATAMLAWTIGEMERGVVHIDHPRYFGLFNPGATFPAQCAERIAAAFNPQLATATTSPFPVALEAHLIGAIAARAFMPAGSGGHFTSSGSEANATAVICALTRAEPRFAQEGARAFTGQPVIYASRAAHLAWIKIAHQVGIGRRAVRLIATDGTGRMDAAALDKTIAADIAAGHVPVMIAATAGTTGAGMIDPLEDCAAIAHRAGAWYHVDAAWGGALVFSDRRRAVLAGMRHADSITIDAHKWLATTMACGIFLTAHPAVLQDSFQVTMECMPSNLAGLDPYVTTAQWSRRFLGLRLFLGLAIAGWDGYATHLERAIANAASLKSALAQSGWRCLNDSGMAVLNLRPPEGAPDAATIARQAVADGGAWISPVEFEGETVLRICITHGETTQADLDALAALLGRLAAGQAGA